MFVANHNSWMDIPFMGATIGWRNYKFVAKKELEKVPILSAAIVTADNLMVDRKDKRSGLRTLRAGMEFLKKGIHLCTFPEGTRSRDGRLKGFLGGAFKMAHKVGAPVIPLSIVGAQHVQPIHWMFPLGPSRRRIKVVVHPPVESKGLTEAELSEKVRQAMVDGLPDDQKPLED
jgi:1-acyl-sn-glycerol-3-phosphate acyltransferase